MLNTECTGMVIILELHQGTLPGDHRYGCYPGTLFQSLKSLMIGYFQMSRSDLTFAKDKMIWRLIAWQSSRNL